MKVTYFGDDLGWGFYTFKGETLIDALYYVAQDGKIFDRSYTSYRISKIIQKKKYIFFGENTIIIEMTRDRDDD